MRTFLVNLAGLALQLLILYWVWKVKKETVQVAKDHWQLDLQVHQLMDILTIVAVAVDVDQPIPDAIRRLEQLYGHRSYMPRKREEPRDVSRPVLKDKE